MIDIVIHDKKLNIRKMKANKSRKLLYYAKMHLDNIDFLDIFQLQFGALEIVVECASPTAGCTQLANPPVPSLFYPRPRLSALSLAHARSPPAGPAGVNQQPPMHQLRMSPFNPFCG
jgi:hypothetical protein